MADVNWEKAYRDLEDHIEAILKETSELVNNASPKLRINKVYVQQEDKLKIIVDATGENMEYAIYLIDRKGKLETIKTEYQKSNTFLLEIPNGRYTIQAFVKENGNDGSRVFEKLSVNYKKVNIDE